MKLHIKALAATSICALLVPLGMSSASAGQTTSRAVHRTCTQLGGEFSWLDGHVGYACLSAEGFTQEVADTYVLVNQCSTWGHYPTSFAAYPVGTSDAYYVCRLEST
jgi:hypothetical protein